MTVVSLTLIEAIIAVLIIAFLATMLTTIILRSRAAIGSAGTGTLRPAPKRFVWVAAPATFPVNTEATFTFRLEQVNPVTGAWRSLPNEDTLVGAVTPATVLIVSVNGSAPGSATAFPDYVGVPGTAFEAETDDSGLVTFVLKGPQPADATFYVVYATDLNDVTTESKQFVVVPPP